MIEIDQSVYDGRWFVIDNGFQWGKGPLDASGASAETFASKHEAFAAYIERCGAMVDSRAENFDTALGAFVSYCQQVCSDHNAANYPRSATPTIKTTPGGQKFVRIVREAGPDNCSVYCFVEVATGNVLYPASYKAPSLKTPPRGNIFTPDNYGVDYYGAKRLR